MITKTKTIKMLLYDGSLNGVTNISDSAWESGKMYSAPRDSIKDLASRADCKKYGVYLLLSEQQVYVGQAVDLERRTKQHLADKDWWNQVILMTTKDDSFNASDIDYLESRLIDLAGKACTTDSENRKKGNPQKVDEFRQAELEQYLDEALFLLELIGIKIFRKNIKKSERTISLQTNQPKQNVTTIGAKPQLPSFELGPCAFVKEAFTNLINSGFVFTEEQIHTYSSVEGSREYTKRNLPLFWLLGENESYKDLDKSILARYWKVVFVSNNYRFLMYSQWYDNPSKSTKDLFVKWYNSI